MRENFAIEASLIRMRLEQLLAQTNKIEEQIRKEMDSIEDTYIPDIESDREMPPTKRCRRTK